MKEVVRVRRELRKARRHKDAKRLERELKQAQIECAYAQHWVMLRIVWRWALVSFPSPGDTKKGPSSYPLLSGRVGD
jgi:hypothetical protein